MEETKKHFHRVRPAPGIYWVKSGWMWEGEFSAAGAVMTRSSGAGFGSVWVQSGECFQAWQKLWKLLPFPLDVLVPGELLGVLVPDAHSQAAQGDHRPQFLLELALSTQGLYWTWVWGQGTICSGQGLLGMVLDRGKASSSDCALCVCSRQFTFVNCPGVWSGWAWEHNTAWRLVRSKFQRIIELSAVWVSQLWNIIHPTACICI